jgi:hypothetical protein
MDEQVVPELPAQLDQDGAPGPRLERGDLRVQVRAADDAGGVLPRGQIFRGDGVGDNVLLGGVPYAGEGSWRLPAHVGRFALY